MFEMIGRHWIPIDFNPLRVIENEAGKEIDDRSAAFDESFVRMYYPRIHGESLSLKQAVELAQTADLKHYVEGKLRQELEAFAIDLNSKMLQWRGDKSIQKRMKANLKSLRGKHNTEFVYRMIQIILFKQAFEFKHNHVIDFWHTVVPTANADMIVLDKHWTEIARQVRLPLNKVRIYPVGNIDVFLNELESAEILSVR